MVCCILDVGVGVRIWVWLGAGFGRINELRLYIRCVFGCFLAGYVALSRAQVGQGLQASKVTAQRDTFSQGQRTKGRDERELSCRKK